MRKLHNSDYRQRGCVYCNDTVRKRRRNADKKYRIHCIHDECPYHELDNIKSYYEYMKKLKGGTIENLIEFVTSCD